MMSDESCGNIYESDIKKSITFMNGSSLLNECISMFTETVDSTRSFQVGGGLRCIYPV